MHAILTIRGAAEVLKQELQELGISANVEAPDWCSADLDSNQLQLVRLRSQLAIRVLELIAAVAREELAAAAVAIKPSGSFCVRASGQDRQELEEELGAIIHDTTGKPVNLTAPDTLYYVYESSGKYLLGIDLYRDLAKRHYKIITGSQSLAGPVAAAALRITGWTPKLDLVVWPCATGELAIEAALSASKKSPRAYELKILDEQKPECRILAADPRLSMVRSSEKNAKVAGVHQHIRFSRQDADWLDTKHDEAGVQVMAGLLPNLKLQPKLAKEIVYQLDFILSKDGKAGFVCVNEDSAALLEREAASYKLSRQYIWSGKQALTIVLLQKIKTEETKG